ncbi:hypothetical protein B0H14DRAFT_3440722 [Mycena olivaceomarginata]|nr:hypothetical protein B0H14DRAFT_3440722 [Mycena olivaceomarginata]
MSSGFLAISVHSSSGLAGTGKSTLMTMVAKYLEEKYIENRSIAVIRFHFHYRDTETITFTRLREYILQRLIFRRALKATVEQLLPYYLRLQSRPLDDLVLMMLRAELEMYSRMFLILDALDEAPGGMGKAHSLETVGSTARQRQRSLHLTEA